MLLHQQNRILMALALLALPAVAGCGDGSPQGTDEQAVKPTTTRVHYGACGNGVCGVHEDCSTCPADCGLCPGAACATDGECGRAPHGSDPGVAGHCVDGVCCNTACGGACDACNVPGAVGTCTLLGTSTVCRASVGACDVAETCSGASADCPADTVAKAGTVCRASAGACDVPEVCDGTGAACPSDGFAAAGTVCGGAGGLKQMSFVDTGGDDIATDAVASFFSKHPTSASDFIFFEITGAPGYDGAWCSERADWYANEYLTNASTSAIRWSGTWNKWTRPEGGDWTWTNESVRNFYGSYCDSVSLNAWCSEYGLGGRYLAVLPGRSGGNESYVPPVGYSNGAGWTITIRVGASFDEACNGATPAPSTCSGSSATCP